MPSSLIETCRECTPDEEISMLDAIHDALVAAFKIPIRDRHVRLVVHEPHRMATPPDLAEPHLYTLVTVDCFAGRSIAAKRALYRGIVERLSTLGVPSDHVTIIVRESETENWGISGGHAACDIDLGFDVRV